MNRRPIAPLWALLPLALVPATAPSVESPAEVPPGLIIQVDPWRSPDGRVRVDYTVHLEGAELPPGTLLSAWRQTRIGRSQGAPLVQVGYLSVVASHRGNAIARAIPGAPVTTAHLDNPVVQLGDLIRPATGYRPGRAGIELPLGRFFEGDSGVLTADSDKALAELLKGASAPVMLTLFDGATGPIPPFERASTLARALADQGRMDPTQIFVQTLPLTGSGTARVELRSLPSEDPPPRAKRSSGP